MSSDISASIELDVTKKHNLIMQPMASATGQQIQLSGTVPLQTFPGNMIKFDLNVNKAIISLIASSQEANIETIRTPVAEDIFNTVFERIQSSSDKDRESVGMILEILRDSLSPGAENQDLLEKLKQVYQDRQSFDAILVKSGPYVLEAFRKLLDSALMVK